MVRLAGKELKAQRERLEAVMAWFGGRVGHRQSEVDLDDLARVAGDYRLARCLSACLLPSFRFAARPLDEALAEYGPAVLEAAAAAGVRSPSDLRLAVFDRVGQQGGFVTPGGRAALLAAA